MWCHQITAGFLAVRLSFVVVHSEFVKDDMLPKVKGCRADAVLNPVRDHVSTNEAGMDDVGLLQKSVHREYEHLNVQQSRTYENVSIAARAITGLTFRPTGEHVLMQQLQGLQSSGNRHSSLHLCLLFGLAVIVAIFVTLGVWCCLPARGPSAAEVQGHSEETHSAAEGFPVFGEDIAMWDIHRSDVVLVFPRELKAEVIDNPQDLCEKMFRKREGRRDEKLFSSNQQVPKQEFQTKVRQQIVDILMEYGIIVDGHTSFDDDEMFVLLRISRKDQVTRDLAKAQNVLLPIKTDAVCKLRMSGVDACDFPKIDETKSGEIDTSSDSEQSRKDDVAICTSCNECGKSCIVRCGTLNDLWKYPKTNENSKAVPAYMEYDGSDNFDEFSSIVQVRMIDHVMRSCFNMDELVNQEVITQIFPLPKPRRLRLLLKRWVRLGYWQSLCPPLPTEDDTLEHIREYYGESIAFFFEWYAKYIQFLIPLAATSLLILASHLLSMPMKFTSYIRLAYSGCVILWAATFNKRIERKLSGTSLRWGMANVDLLQVSRTKFNADLESTWTLCFREYFVAGAILIYGLFFVACVFFLRKSTTKEYLGQYESIAMSALIFAFSMVWSKLAPLLANLQNHRTALGYERSLVVIVAPVKLFLALFPFLSLAFLQKYAQVTCGDTLEEVARSVYGSVREQSSWPTLQVWQNQSLLASAQPVWDSNGSLSSVPANVTFLESYTKHWGGQVCMYGCYPEHCFQDLDGLVHCWTNCSYMLDRSLLTFYISHAASTLVFIIIGFVSSKYEIHEELQKHAKQARERNFEPNRTKYSVTDIESKKKQYKYQSWGGSRVEDFTELAINFSLLTCFSAQVPTMAIPALICNVLEYRFLAFRMTAVTQRPYPQVSDGIGVWQSIFESIANGAVIVNCALAVFAQAPMDAMGEKAQFAWFIAFEHIGLALIILVGICFHAQPTRVRRIAEFNSRLVSKLRFFEFSRVQGLAQDVGQSKGSTHGSRRSDSLDPHFLEGLTLKEEGIGSRDQPLASTIQTFAEGSLSDQ
eukprot:TRINITY_DN2393_c0_g2_i1.p1 TRINITY_DN2393_c0_g2~~TRINITY_DN2393_c0_g2_i1.p1  ORF type:complete len:1038 (+),score=139.99 TRINITY_DN2393_c0_g2_i1:269-3382(+)